MKQGPTRISAHGRAFPLVFTPHPPRQPPPHSHTLLRVCCLEAQRLPSGLGSRADKQVGEPNAGRHIRALAPLSPWLGSRGPGGGAGRAFVWVFQSRGHRVSLPGEGGLQRPPPSRGCGRSRVNPWRRVVGSENTPSGKGRGCWAATGGGRGLGGPPSPGLCPEVGGGPGPKQDSCWPWHTVRGLPGPGHHFSSPGHVSTPHNLSAHLWEWGLGVTLTPAERGLCLKRLCTLIQHLVREPSAAVGSSSPSPRGPRLPPPPPGTEAAHPPGGDPGCLSRLHL